MDKVKIVLDVLKKHHFWALVGLVVLLGLWIYMAAAADLEDKTAKRVSTLKSASGQVDGIANRSDHANEKKIAILKDKKKQQEQKVREAWQSLYDEQRKINRWPLKLGEKFRKKVEEQLSPNDPIPDWCCNNYWRAIKNAIPELLETVDYQRYVPLDPDEKQGNATKAAPRLPSPSRGRLSGLRGSQDKGKPVGTVIWKNYDLIQSEFIWPSRPTSSQVRLAQENYWVYKALLSIISKTNGGAKTHSDAAVKEIVALLIGQEAAKYITGSPIDIVGSSAPSASRGSPSGAGMFEDSGMGGPSARGRGTGSTGASSTAIDDMLLNNRYVDGSLKPLTTEQAKNSPPYKEFKMMPIVMNLVVDEDKIPRLLVECANSAMPVEVVQLRINPEKGKRTVSKGMASRPKRPGMSGPRSPMGPTDPIGFEDEGGGYAGGSPYGGAGSKGFGDDEPSPFEVSIEMRGIIYIYNPPLETTGDATTNGSSE